MARGMDTGHQFDSRLGVVSDVVRGGDMDLATWHAGGDVDLARWVSLATWHVVGCGFGEVGVVGDVARRSDGVCRFDSRVGVVVEVACGRCDMGVVGDVACNGAALTTWYAVGVLI